MTFSGYIKSETGCTKQHYYPSTESVMPCSVKIWCPPHSYTPSQKLPELSCPCSSVQTLMNLYCSWKSPTLDTTYPIYFSKWQVILSCTNWRLVNHVAAEPTGSPLNKTWTIPFTSKSPYPSSPKLSRFTASWVTWQFFYSAPRPK